MSKVAAIVGVGPGIGAATAKKFAREGYSVALLSRGREKLEKAKAEIEKEVGTKTKILIVEADSSDADQVTKAFQTIRESLGEPEVLVYNASAWRMAPFLELKPEDLHNTWKVTALGAFLNAQAVLPSMVKNKKGTIIFTGATASLRGGNKFAAFASSKFALRGLAQSIAREFGPQGIHVSHVIIDGGVDTQHTQKETLIFPDAIADTYWHLHAQHHTSWTFELDLRPDVEKW